MILLAVHTSFGHQLLPREEVAPTLRKFALSFARLPFPVAPGLSGELIRSVYGSQENAQTRLQYLLEEWTGRSGDGT